MALAVLTLPRWSQLYVAVLLTPVAMFSSGTMRKTKMWRWVVYSVS